MTPEDQQKQLHNLLRGSLSAFIRRDISRSQPRQAIRRQLVS